ncbi:hypothetical protein FDENT_1185 [Fusarium denticulatum]|uniref:Peptidase C14 caspase domain-containing protein n=1 Tax=Fusarium denticulatum TaxID=48507 RepID=A0A8H5XJ13_9HYPO|nr:hypothetical protein FDENT_1185 [Fusarium denticulatum]
MSPPSEPGQKWAVLIGVDYYIKGSARPGISFRNLKGCVEDVLKIREYLQDSKSVKESNIFQLTATTPDSTQLVPKEDESKWPTYDNIVKAFEEITKKASANDVIYIHYSGHGIRTATIFGDLKGDIQLDEALVPTDISCEGGRYVRDVEIAYLLQEMVKRGLIVTLVVDCCHSGGASRGKHDSSHALVRGVATIDKNALPGDQSNFPRDKLREIAGRSTQADHGSRKATVKDHWLLRSSGYVFLAACQQHESAIEDRFGDRTQGLLTYYLLETLRETKVAMNHHQLWTLVALKVAKRSKQRVILGGECNRLFLSSDSSQIFNAATVIGVNTEPEGPTTAKINAGQTHGIEVDTKLDVWPPSCSNFLHSERLGYLLVTSVTELAAETEFKKTSEVWQPLQVGCLAIPCSTVSQKRVRLIQHQDSMNLGATSSNLEALRNVWADVGTSFAPLLNTEDDEEYFQVRIDGGTYIISGKDGRRLQYTVPPLPIEGDDTPRKLVHWLTHLAKYHSVLELVGRQGNGVLYSVYMSPKPNPQEEDKKPRKAFDPIPKPAFKSKVKVVDKGLLVLQIKNESDFVVNITVLDLDSSWEIAQIHPQGYDVGDSLEAGQSLYIPLRMSQPEGSIASDVSDTILVFATPEPTSFRWLELPELVKVDEKGRRGAKSELHGGDMRETFQMASRNPLEALKTAWGLDGPAETRAIQQPAPQRWAVIPLELTADNIGP